MSISEPRYGSAPVPRLGRTYRSLAIVRRELVRRSSWGTWLTVALAYLAVTVIVAVDVFFASLIGTLSLTTFEAPYENPVWPFFVLIVATVVGAGSLADDIGNRSIALYLSRPIHLSDYLVAKASATGLWIVIAAVGPGLAGLAIVVALGEVPTSIALSAAAGYVAIGLLAAVFFTGVALALSSLTTRSLYSGVATFGVVLSLEIGAGVVSGISGNTTVQYAAPFTDLRIAARGAFGVAGPFSTDPVVSATLLAASGVVLGLFAAWRLSRVEVVGE
jgi:ABC-type transport system involved in multi-copper enzyme maturation permease subunit